MSQKKSNLEAVIFTRLFFLRRSALHSSSRGTVSGLSGVIANAAGDPQSGDQIGWHGLGLGR